MHCLEMPANHNQSHRTDIDGLRALAILPVLLCHARLGCPGGYVGVDIFFVLSGYLITSLILKEQAEGVFSLIGFWERRIRRIFPAMALMLGGTFLLGWFLLLPEDFQLMAKSAIAQAAMLSNVFFYQQMSDGNGYFGPNADTIPLLHTWSLSVEEQFYLFFPVLMTLVLKRRILLRVVGVLGLLSFLMSVWYFVPQYYDSLSVARHPGAFFQLVFGYWHRVALSVAPTMGSFFLLPSRAWELLLGALLALMRGKLVIEKGARELLAWLGVGMIGFTIFCYNDKTPFPGITAIPPCLGAALIIFSNEEELCLTGRLLSFRPVVFVGLISYSLYLWHWPLLVFDKYPAFIKPGPWQRASVLAVSFVLATLSWKYVETPIRTRKIFPRRDFLFAFAGCTATVFLVLGFWVYSSGGVPARFSPEVNRYAAFRNHFVQVLSGQVVELGFTNSTPFNLIVWGDSHAMAVAPVINDLCHKYSLHGALDANDASSRDVCQ
jgi:peptidoglycan/LPS O-acetylase OafA/YrhL